MSKKQELTPQQVDRINADFAEHVLGWMAVGKRRVIEKHSTGDREMWQGVPSRDDILRDVPNAWYRLEDAMQGIYHHPVPRIYLERNGNTWYCGVQIRESDNLVLKEYASTPAQAIVRCLLRFVGHEEHLPPRDEPEGA